MMVANVFVHIIPGSGAWSRRSAPASRGPAPRPGGQALGAQHLLHPAGAVHHDQQPLPDDLLAPQRLVGAGGDDAGRVLIRQFFVLRHQGQVKWWLPAAGTALLAF